MILYRVAGHNQHGIHAVGDGSSRMPTPTETVALKNTPIKFYLNLMIC